MPSLLMRGILKKDNRLAAPMVTRAVTGGVSKYLTSSTIIERLKQRGRLAQIDARTIHATGTDPSGLGKMQPEGRSQQSKLKMQKDTCHRDRPVRLGDNAARGAPPTE